jgi:hypothetical protein
MTGTGPDAAVLKDSPLCLCDTLRMTARAVTVRPNAAAAAAGEGGRTTLNFLT